MSKEEYNQLETLLGKLQVELGFKYCIIPNHLQDGYYIGLYNSKGENFKGTTNATIESTAKILIKDLSEHE